MSANHLLQLAFGAMHPQRAHQLIDEFGVAPTVRRITEGRLRCSDEIRQAVRVPAAEREAQLAAAGVRFLTPAALPEKLVALPDAPRWLFVRGGELPATGVAVVGSRAATTYGLGIAASIGRTVAMSGWPVVSGLAAGVDAAAHQGCLDGSGRAVAVLGSGINVWYPASNRTLGERIIRSGGVVVSEFPPGIRPEPWRFPARNRIISGLARVVIVVEAAVRSGALITARLALEQGREVIAVPGDIDRESSAGCNLLIRDGAYPLVGLDELVDALGFVLGSPPVQFDRGEVMGGAVGPVPIAIDDLAVDLGHDASVLMRELAVLESMGKVIISDGMVRAV